MKSLEGKRLNGQTCSVVKLTESHIEVAISGGVSSFVEKDGTPKKFILKPENLSPKCRTSFSGFSFGKDCQETKKNIPQGKRIISKRITFSVDFDFYLDNLRIANAFKIEVDTKSNSFTDNSFSLVDNLKNPSKFSLIASSDYTCYRPFNVVMPKCKNPLSFEFGQRDKEIAALKKISLFVSKKKKNIKKIKKQKEEIVNTSDGPFARRPREMLVWILEFFTVYEVASLQRLVCREFRDAGQERIHERGGRKLYEEGMAFMFGYDHKTIDEDRGWLLLHASLDAGCKTAFASLVIRGQYCVLSLVKQKMVAPNLSDEYKLKILKDFKEISTSSPYHWVDYYIALCYKRGWGGEEKKNQAVKWVEKAVHKGNTSAMCNLGLSYRKGNLGLAQSFTKANELWALAAEKGNAKARYNLGNSYRKGRGGLAVDFNRCVELWEQSAKQGIVQAQTSLGRMYRKGSRDGPPMTIPVDPQLSFKWMLAAAEQGHADSMNDIGIHCENGTGGLDQNLGTAFEWFMKSAVEGNQHGQYNVGSYYENGKGTATVDLLQALHWFQKAAAQEFSQAQFSVGYFFEHGRGGIPIDLEQALHWYQKAAAQEHTRAMEAVARLSSN
jgi:TPR repeat protein